MVLSYVLTKILSAKEGLLVPTIHSIAHGCKQDKENL